MNQWRRDVDKTSWKTDLCGIFHTPSKWDMSFDVVTWSSEGNKVVIDPVFPLFSFFWGGGGGVMAAGFSLLVLLNINPNLP